MTGSDVKDTAWASSTPKRITIDRAAESAALKSVASALDVLECFATDGDLGVSDVARRLGVAKSTAHRILTTLTTRGFVEQDPETGFYRLGLHIFELGQLAQARNTIRHAALPTLRQVAVQTGLTVNLGIPDGPDVVFVERIEFGAGGRILSHAGRRFPAHTVSSGKAIAAFNPLVLEARVRAGFPPRVSHTIRTRADFDRAIDKVRRDGFAISRDESFDGAASVAVPILKHKVAVASLSVFGTTEAIAPEVDKLVPLLHAASTRIAKRIPG
jgi:DNA-binding IclR family transcriptional regulator